MSFVRTLMLALVAAGLGAWIWMVEKPAQEREARGDLLLDVEPASVARLRLSYPDGSAIAVAREGAGWKMTEPLATDADATTVENFLGTIRDTRIERRLPPSEAGALADYGLAGDQGSQARIEVTTTDGRALPAVVLGIATPVGYQAFARRSDGDDVLVIPLLLQSSARKTPFDLRRKTVFDADAAAGATRIVVEGPAGRMELERGQAGQPAAAPGAAGDWRMVAPRSDAADPELVAAWLDSLASVEALAFVDGEAVDAAGLGLDAAATRITITRADGRTVAFALGKDAPDPPAGTYLRRESDGQVAKVADAAAARYRAAADTLRDRRLLHCRSEDVRRMTWTSAGESFTLSREDTGKPWVIAPEIAGQVVNQRIVDNTLEGLASARADAVVGDAADEAALAGVGLEAPAARLVVEGRLGRCAALSAAAGPVAATAPTKPGAPASFLAKEDSRTALLRVSAHEYSRLSPRRSQFVDAAPPQAPTEPPAKP